jgi:hypothetical protein
MSYLYEGYVDERHWGALIDFLETSGFEYEKESEHSFIANGVRFIKSCPIPAIPHDAELGLRRRGDKDRIAYLHARADEYAAQGRQDMADAILASIDPS